MFAVKGRRLTAVGLPTWWALASAGLLATAALMSLYRSGRVPLPYKEYALVDFVHELNHCYQSPLGFITITHDEAGHSPLRLLEDGRPLGPADSDHDAIRQQGRGRFSFWSGYLYFSASDNSDPRSNGRSYVTQVPYWIPSWTIYFVAVLGAMSAAVTLHACSRQYRATSRGWPSFDAITGLLESNRVHRVGVAIASTAIGFAFLLALTSQYPTLAITERMAFRLVAAGCFGVVGYQAMLAARSRGGAAVTRLIATATWTLLAAYALFRPDWFPVVSNIEYEPRWPLATVALGAMLAIHRDAGASLDRSSLPRLLPLAVLCAVAVSAPGMLFTIARGWNTSGWMDSASMDMAAHLIATGRSYCGDSFVMPLYQYALAAVYYSWGHFFWASQTFNLVLAALTVAFITLAAWELYRRMSAVWFAAIGAAVSTQLRLYLLIPQVENIYVPVFAFAVWMWARYWRRGTLGAAVWLGLAAGLVVNTRSQGAFFCAALTLAPLAFKMLPLRRRLAQALVASGVGMLTLLPWTVRNYVCDGRFSPTSEQADVVLLFSHPGVAGYGLRHDLTPWRPILKDYIARYGEDYRSAIRRDFVANTLRRPGWMVQALWWRSAAFYGLLTPGFMAPDGPTRTNWTTEWQTFVAQKWPQISLILMSLLGLIVGFGRTTLYLAVLIGGNLAVLFFGSQTEGRMWLPLTAVHLLIAVAAICPPREDLPAWSANEAYRGWASRWQRRAAWAVASVALVAVASRVVVGAHNAYAALPERTVRYEEGLALDSTLPSLNHWYEAHSRDGVAPPRLQVNARVRFRFLASNNMLPPKIVGGGPWMFERATALDAETYFVAVPFPFPSRWSVLDDRASVTFQGALLSKVLREGDIVDAECLILSNQHSITLTGPPIYWMRVEKALISSTLEPISILPSTVKQRYGT